MKVSCLTIALGVLVGASVRLHADDAKLEFFEKKIRPALVTYCYECHSADSKNIGGSLVLDHRDGLRQGGDSGAAVKPGSPDDSLLIKAIRYTDDSIKMPPKGKLPESVIADLTEWVKSGAEDPRDEPTRKKATASWEEIMKERRDWWSLRPVTSPTPPTAAGNGPRNSPVDRFIDAKLAESGLVPAPPTDPRTLIRRLSLVLTGLPPTIEQVDQFVSACQSGSPQAIYSPAVESLVDTLLQSPHFGEHWARHWMDVVRFSETHGNEWNYEVHHAWRYRDYLIRAFNSDVPYDQFIREHIAGDLLPNPRWNEAGQFNESVIGTGFYRFGEVNHDDCISLRSLGYDLADNQIDTLTKAFQATTVACARCHNHKLDPISSEDYYALLAVIRSSRNVSHGIDSPEVNRDSRKRLQELKAELRRELAQSWLAEAETVSQYMYATTAIRTQKPNAAELSQPLNPQRLEKWTAALAIEKQGLEEPFEVWRKLVAAVTPAQPEISADATAVSQSLAQTWESLKIQFQQEIRARRDFNGSRFESFGDFRGKDAPDWMKGGMALVEPPSNSGDFVLNTDGELIVQSILPAGRFTHSLSSKMNGTLRSQMIPAGKKYISFQVLGQRSSAVRLVSNHCQLNYANYRALTSPDLQWVTFSPPPDRESLRTYAELMTMFDNPKFPDQLSALGGDGANYKLPWDKAAENPRSWFGITRVVLHDLPETPIPELSHLTGLFAGPDENTPVPAIGSGIVSTADDADTKTLQRLLDRYQSRIREAIEAWGRDQAVDDDVRWLDSLVRRELISNRLAGSPRLEALVQEYRKVESGLALPRVTVGVSDGGPGIEQPVFVRGDCFRPGETVPRRFLEVLSGKPKPFTSIGSGRLELAEQIASPANPLTSRVMVNRIWHHLFGTGLVRTVDDFGHVGEIPSHPELLDYLAGQFVADGWSVKRMIKSLVMTQTFQASNRPSLQSQEVDPQNRLLQHYSARRMEAESVRDSILAASGSLKRELFGQSIQPFREKEYADRRLFPGPLDGHGRRSIYIKNNLMEAPKFLSAFNFPGGKVTQGRRDVTNVPAQALALMNDPFVLQQATIWSVQLVTHSSDSIPTRVEGMFRSALGRSPTAEEQTRFGETIRQLADLYQVKADDVMSSADIWKDISHAIFNLNEMIYIP